MKEGLMVHVNLMIGRLPGGHKRKILRYSTSEPERKRKGLRKKIRLELQKWKKPRLPRPKKRQNGGATYQRREKLFQHRDVWSNH